MINKSPYICKQLKKKTHLTPLYQLYASDIHKQYSYCIIFRILYWKIMKVGGVGPNILHLLLFGMAGEFGRVPRAENRASKNFPSVKKHSEGSKKIYSKAGSFCRI